jgi:hypothetical protein
MGNLVKKKLLLLSISSAVIVVISLLENFFYFDPVLKKWEKEQPLSWDDFQGIPRYFSAYGAAISSTVDIAYDSSAQSYTAFAVQNSSLSWKSAEAVEDEEVLEHEQYHFNITEYHARLLNGILAQNKDWDAERASAELDSTNLKLNQMQDSYDEQTDHSLIFDQQRWWEYRIDSMLWAHDPSRDSVFDLYTGTSAYFYKPPFFSQSAHPLNSYRGYGLDAYDMNMAIWSYQYETDELIDLEESLDEKYIADSVEVREKSSGTFRGWEKYAYTYHDSIYMQEVSETWINGPDYLYKLYVAYPLVEYNEGYKAIAKSFLSTVDIMETDSIWIKDFQVKHQKEGVGRIGEWHQADSAMGPAFCYNFGDSIQYLFFKKPFFDQQKNMHLVFTPLADSIEVKQGIVMINEDYTYGFGIDSADQHIIIPAADLPAKDFLVQFGYLMEADTGDCQNYYYDQHYWLKREEKVLVRK